MAQIEIPDAWRKQVCAILATEKTGSLIEWTLDATKRFQADSDFAWPYEIYQAFRDYLSMPHAGGCPVTMQNPAGETYEFLFPFQQALFYGKILLRSDQQRVVVFSAHKADYVNLSCE